ncbi:MAG TPA: glycoside hydrolase family 31 protein [Phycisphaerae bacterium]|nr:glycoside hydrolase family 31 protein [Phycisphaerae bacterium]
MSTHSNLPLTRTDASEISGWRSLGPVTGYERESTGILIACGDARLRVSLERSGIVRVRLAPDGEFDRDHSWAVLPFGFTHPAWKLEDEKDHLTLISSSLRVVIQKNPCRIEFHSMDGIRFAAMDPSKGIAWDGDEVCCWMQMKDEDHFFGLGERGMPLDKRGQVVVNWNHDAAEHDPWTDPLHQSHPFVIRFNAGQAHGIFFDNAHRATFDLGKTSLHNYSFGAQGGEMNFYFIPGPTTKDVIRRYGSLVGTQPLPPLWSLGYQQCRWSYESAKRVRDIAKRLRKHRIPCDTIYLDIDYMDGFRCFTWDRERFPNPLKLLHELADDGFKTVLIVEPGIKKEPGYGIYDAGIVGRHFCNDETGRPYVGKVWPGDSVYPDFTRAATRKWWGELYREHLEEGVAGFWNDMNEPADFTFPTGTVPMTVRHDNDGQPAEHGACHNVYGMNMARATHDGVCRLREGERPFVLTRAGYSGVQRYAAVWTGDNLSSWEHLRMSIAMLLNMGLSGMAFVGADIGGFRGHPSPELYTRWLQLGIFYPLCRTHTCGGLEKDAPEQDPTAFGRKFTAINRKTIELRYRLMPYLYTQMHEVERSGIPMMRPMLLDFPELEKVHQCEMQFMWGDQILVAPVVEEKAKKRKLRLPAGPWYGFESGAPIEGGEDVTVKAKLDRIPMFARAGAVIPMREPVQFTNEKPLDELVLAIFPGDGAGAYYNDDGHSYNYRDGAFVREEYAATSGDITTTFTLTAREGSVEFIPPSYQLQFKNWRKAPTDVTLDGQSLPSLKRKSAADGGPGWWHDHSSRTLLVRIAGLQVDQSIAATMSR